MNDQNCTAMFSRDQRTVCGEQVTHPSRNVFYGKTSINLDILTYFNACDSLFFPQLKSLDVNVNCALRCTDVQISTTQ